MEGDHARCAKLNASLHDTQEAQRSWWNKYSHELKNMGSKRGRASPCAYWHKGWEVRLVVHGDDFFSAGSDHQVAKHVNAVQSIFDVKFAII